MKKIVNLRLKKNKCLKNGQKNFKKCLFEVLTGQKNIFFGGIDNFVAGGGDL